MVPTALLCALLFQQGPAAPPPSGDPAQVVVDQKKARAEQQHQKDIDNDIKLGKEFSAEVEKTEKLSDNKEYQARVDRIGQQIAEIARTVQVETFWGDPRLNKFNYTFKVLKNPPDQPDEVNAFSLPGGIIYVYEGLVKYAESDDEIAAVLAHEISHAEERHIATLSREQEKIATPGLLGVLIAIATRNPDAIEATIMLQQLTVQSFTSEWSVKAEKAADHGGFQYLLHSKYNPTAMLTFMERLAQDERNDPARSMDWGIYKTHPPGRERAEAVLKDMRTYGVPVQRSLVTTRYRTEIKTGTSGVEIWFNKRKLYTFGGSDALERADEAAERLNRFFDQSPNLFDVIFDGKEVLGKRSPLIEVRPEDAQDQHVSVDDLGDRTVAAIKGMLYSYAFNIWGAK